MDFGTILDFCDAEKMNENDKNIRSASSCRNSLSHFLPF
jgi:hypothetical protein